MLMLLSDMEHNAEQRILSIRWKTLLDSSRTRELAMVVTTSTWFMRTFAERQVADVLGSGPKDLGTCIFPRRTEEFPTLNVMTGSVS